MFKVLTIAGSDSCGGAGIQADQRAVNSLGGYAATVITAITSQNTTGIRSIFALPDDIVNDQLDAVLSDIKFDAVKTGMLYSSSVIEIIAKKLKRYKVKNLVIDPVTISKSGNTLLKKNAVQSLISSLIPLSLVITPNIEEAGLLAGMKIGNLTDMKVAAKKIYRMGARNVLIKGGHLKGLPLDLLYDGKKYTLYEGTRIDTKNTHGIGCAFSAIIASYLAINYSLKDAISNAKKIIESSLKNAEDIGKGQSSPDTNSWVVDEAMSYEAIEDAKKAYNLLAENSVGDLVAEVQMNIVSAKRNAEKVDDIAAFPGRIFKINDKIYTHSSPRLGASSHMARVLLAARKFDKTIFGAINIKYSPSIISACRKAGLKVMEFSRKDEPLSFKKKEGQSLDWGVQAVLSKTSVMPDVIFDRGGIGKEAMVRVFGKSAVDSAQKILKIQKCLR